MTIFKLIHQDTKESLVMNLEDLQAVNFCVGGYRLPDEIYKYLSQKQKEAWDIGWRGYLIYFEGGPVEAKTLEEWIEKIKNLFPIK